MVTRSMAGEAAGPKVHDSPVHDPHPTVPTPTIRPGPATATMDPVHIAAFGAVADASMQVLSEDMANLRTLMKQMVDAKGDTAARDDIAKKANEEIIHIHAVAEAAQGYLLSPGEKSAMSDALRTINKEYSDSIKEAGYSRPQYVSIEGAKPALNGEVRSAFESSLNVYHHDFEEAAAHMRDFLAAMGAATEKTVSDMLEGSGLDVMLLTEKLARIKMLVRDGSPVVAPVGEGPTPIIVPPDITVAPVVPDDGSAPTESGPTHKRRPTYPSTPPPMGAAATIAVPGSSSTIPPVTISGVNLPEGPIPMGESVEELAQFLRDTDELLKKGPEGASLVLKLEDVQVTSYKLSLLSRNGFKALMGEEPNTIVIIGKAEE